jgi:cytoskeletal protein RodZ
MDAYSLGRYLREARERLDLTLDDAVYVLKIRRTILEAFEQGEFNIPDRSDVQVRGFIRNYARYLRLDEALILQYYESSKSNRRTGRQGRTPTGKYSRRRQPASSKKRDTQNQTAVLPSARKVTDTNPIMPRVPMTDYRDEQNQWVKGVVNVVMILMIGGIAFGVIFFVLFQLVNQPTTANPDEGDTRGIIGQLPQQSTRTVAPTFTPRPIETDQPALQQIYTGQGVVVTIEMQQRGWLSIQTDDRPQLARVFLPNELVEFSATEQIIVETSNAAALNVIYNGQQQGTFGARGQAATIIFTPERYSITSGPGPQPLIPPTATETPLPDMLPATLIATRTATHTPGPSPTPTETLTPSATPTASDTPTETPLPSATPTITHTPTETLTPTVTLTPSQTPTITHTPTETLTPTITLTPTATVVLPVRETPNVTPTPTKEG